MKGRTSLVRKVVELVLAPLSWAWRTPSTEDQLKTLGKGHQRSCALLSRTMKELPLVEKKLRMTEKEGKEAAVKGDEKGKDAAAKRAKWLRSLVASMKSNLNNYEMLKEQVKERMEELREGHTWQGVHAELVPLLGDPSEEAWYRGEVERQLSERQEQAAQMSDEANAAGTDPEIESIKAEFEEAALADVEAKIAESPQPGEREDDQIQKAEA